MPTIYIDTNATINADDWTTATIELFDQNNKIGGNKTWDNTAVSVKFVGDGNDIKTSYRLKFEKKYALLGSKSGSYRQWVLESNDDDPTMLRNGLTEELGDQIGLSFTPGCQYADLIVNGTYVGTYQITDRVKVEGGRVLVSDKNNDWLLEIASNGEVGIHHHPCTRLPTYMAHRNGVHRCEESQQPAVPTILRHFLGYTNKEETDQPMMEPCG